MTLRNSQVYADPLYLKLYEQMDGDLALQQAKSAMALCNIQAGAMWLDACCGFGRHVEAFATLGCETVGLDQSRMMLTRAGGRAREQDLALRYVRADIRQVPFTETFDAVSVLFDSFGFFEDDLQHFDALLSMGLALKPHGTILIQLTNREIVMSRQSGAAHEQLGEYVISREGWYDLPRGRYGWTQVARGEDECHEWQFDLRTYTASEMGDLLERAGFDQVEFFGSWEGAAYDIQSPHMLVKARKAVFSDLRPIPD